MPIAPTSVTGVLAAGGRSSRFGADKSSLQWKGSSFLDRALRELADVVGMVRVGLPPQAPDQPAAWQQIRESHDILEDEPPGIGPMGVLHAALSHAQTDWVLLLAVDLPLVCAPHLKQLLEAARPSSGVVIAEAAGRVQPLCALYHRRELVRVRRLIAADNYAMQGVLEGASVTSVPFSETVLRNVNRPEDVPEENGR